MANDKISAMTAAVAGDLAGSTTRIEVSSLYTTVPATLGCTLALLRTTMFAGGTGYTASDPLVVGNLSASGTSTLTGTVGIGGSGGTPYALWVRSTGLATEYPIGVYSSPTFPSSAIGYGAGFFAEIGTAAASFTMTSGFGMYIANASKGAGSTITTLYGLYIANQTAGTTNYAIYSAGGLNYFAGEVLVQDIHMWAADSNLRISGSSASGFGGVIDLYGHSHATKASYIEMSFTTLKLNSAVVSYGANDSGGSGYKVLRVPN